MLTLPQEQLRQSIGSPGFVGNEARYEENSLARGVPTLVAIGGTVALMASATQLFRPF